jgi:O-antigen/teichoic acid export membrane protein
MLRIVLTELLSRGLLWARVLLIGGVLGAEEYGYLLLLISAETIFGSIISYPQIKEILVRQNCERSHFYSTGALYLLLLPLVLAASYWYFEDYVPALVIAASVLFFAGAQTALYVLRVQNAAIYNRAKMHAAVISTVVFFATLPFNQNLLPLTYLSYFVVLLAAFLRVEQRESAGAGFSVRAVVAGWLIFGAQSLLTQLGQQGNRFVVGAVLSVADVAVFVKSYMLASGITFIYAAIMVKYEKGLSRLVASDELGARTTKAALIGLAMIGLLITYIAGVYGVWLAGLDVLQPVFRDADKSLLLLFGGFFALQALYLVLNPVVIATGRRTWSLMATNVSLLVQVAMIVSFWGELTLQILAASMIAGQFVLVAMLIFGNVSARKLA